MTERARRRPGRPTGRHHVVDRERVLDAAERAIAEFGAGVSIEAIAREAGITKPIVYARVGKRTEVSDALAQRLADRLMDAATVAITGRRTGRTQLLHRLRERLGSVLAAQAGANAYVVDGRFKGGYITRHYGRPADGVHAVQMEMCFHCYMTPPHDYDETRAATVLPVLRSLVETLIGWQP